RMGGLAESPRRQIDTFITHPGALDQQAVLGLLGDLDGYMQALRPDYLALPLTEEERATIRQVGQLVEEAGPLRERLLASKSTLGQGPARQALRQKYHQLSVARREAQARQEDAIEAGVSTLQLHEQRSHYLQL